MGFPPVGRNVEYRRAENGEHELDQLIASMAGCVEAVGRRTPAMIMAKSSQPKFEMIHVRVQIRSKMKTQASARKAMVMRSCVAPVRDTSDEVCAVMLETLCVRRSRDGWMDG